MPSTLDGYRLVPGCGRKFRDNWANGRLPAECVPASQLAAVRCCSGEGGKPNCTSPCSLEVQSSTRACPATRINAFASNWIEARNECSARGQRLCSESELTKQNVCCGGGCYLDHHLVWTGQACATPRPSALEASTDEMTPLQPGGIALRCLRLTTPDLQLASFRNDVDAVAHFDAIQKRLKPWSQDATNYTRTLAGRFKGPWIENAWIDTFSRRWGHHRAQGGKLRDLFGDFVPLFVPWTDIFVAATYKTPGGLIDALRRVLRPDVAYITVSQVDAGLTGSGKVQMATIPNLLVLSAGGFGHAAVPLFKQTERPLGNLLRSEIWLATFRGSESAPDAFRSSMKRTVEATAARRGWATQVDVGVGSIVNWREQMRDTRVRLSPRGCGRTAYHLMETVQMGVLPLHVFLDGDQSWLPYPDVFKHVGFASNLSGLPSVLAHVSALSKQRIVRRRALAILSARTLYTMAGTMQQIARFMRRDGLHPKDHPQLLPPSVSLSELTRLVANRTVVDTSHVDAIRCVPLPPTPRGVLPTCDEKYTTRT
eukprot:scaffold10504_cov67-Phaeocystis_antarctica.AAC.5